MWNYSCTLPFIFTYYIMIRTFGAYRCFATIMIQFAVRQSCKHAGSLALIISSISRLSYCYNTMFWGKTSSIHSYIKSACFNPSSIIQKHSVLNSGIYLHSKNMSVIDLLQKSAYTMYYNNNSFFSNICHMANIKNTETLWEIVSSDLWKNWVKKKGSDEPWKLQIC